MADYGQLSGSGIQTLGTSSTDRGQLSGTGLQAIVTSSINRSQLSGATLQVLVAGPLQLPSSGAIIPVQGELSQGIAYVQGWPQITPIQGKRLT